MGIKIKDFGCIKLKGKKFNVELNGPVQKYVGGIVHIQNENFRIEFSQSDFYRIVTATMLAKANLKIIKGMGK